MSFDLPILYHGSPSGPFDFPDPNIKVRHRVQGEPHSRKAFWMHSNKDAAVRFANGAAALAGKRFLRPGAAVMRTSLKLENPHVVDMQKVRLTPEERKWTVDGHTDIGFRKEREVSHALKNGHDGVVFLHAMDGSFDPGTVVGAFKHGSIHLHPEIVNSTDRDIDVNDRR